MPSLSWDTWWVPSPPIAAFGHLNLVRLAELRNLTLVRHFPFLHLETKGRRAPILLPLAASACCKSLHSVGKGC